MDRAGTIDGTWLLNSRLNDGDQPSQGEVARAFDRAQSTSHMIAKDAGIDFAKRDQSRLARA